MPEDVRFGGGGCREGFRPYEETEPDAGERVCARMHTNKLLCM